MDDKTFDLLSKMYGEFSEFRKDMNEFRKETVERLDKLESGQRKIETIIENDIKTDIKALYDGYKQTYEKLEVLEEKVDDLSTKYEKQEFEIKVFKGGKAAT